MAEWKSCGLGITGTRSTTATMMGYNFLTQERQMVHHMLRRAP